MIRLPIMGDCPRGLLGRREMQFKFRSAALALFVSFLVLVHADFAVAQSRPKDTIDPSVALQYFREAKAASERDGGKLWGMPLNKISRKGANSCICQGYRGSSLIKR